MFPISQWGRLGFLATLALPALLSTSPRAHAGETNFPPALAQALEDGNRAFDSGDFASAIGAYQKVIDSGFLSPDLFLLLGNAHFRTGSEGEAALWWRRAQVADPLLPEPAQNLRFLDSKVGPLRFDSDPVAKITGFLPRDIWVLIATSGAWAFAIGLAALSLHLPRKMGRSFAHLSCWIGLALAILGTAGYLLKTKRDVPFLTDLAVVTRPASARTSATDDAASVSELPPGSEVTSLGDRGPWVYVGIPGNLRGWIRTGIATRLWPYDPDLLQ